MIWELCQTTLVPLAVSVAKRSVPNRAWAEGCPVREEEESNVPVILVIVQSDCALRRA